MVTWFDFRFRLKWFVIWGCDLRLGLLFVIKDLSLLSKDLWFVTGIWFEVCPSLPTHCKLFSMTIKLRFNLSFMDNWMDVTKMSFQMLKQILITIYWQPVSTDFSYYWQTDCMFIALWVFVVTHQVAELFERPTSVHVYTYHKYYIICNIVHAFYIVQRDIVDIFSFHERAILYLTYSSG